MFSAVLNTGCNSKDKDQPDKKFQTKKYDNGAIMLRDANSNSSNQRNFAPAPVVNRVNVGPEKIQFGPENNF